MTVRLSSRRCAAAMIASQLLPSCSSPSPVSTNVRQEASSSFAATAMPTAIGRPCPSGPVLASTPGDLVAIRMAVQLRQRLHVGVELLRRKEPALGQRRVQRRRRVALAEDEAVAIRIARRLGLQPQDVEIQHREDVRAREVAARMPHARLVHHAQAGAPDPPGALQDADLATSAHIYASLGVHAIRDVIYWPAGWDVKRVVDPLAGALRWPSRLSKGNRRRREGETQEFRSALAGGACGTACRGERSGDHKHVERCRCL